MSAESESSTSTGIWNGDIVAWAARFLLLAEAIAWSTWVTAQLVASDASSTGTMSRLGSIAVVTAALVVSICALKGRAGWSRSNRPSRTSG